MPERRKPLDPLPQTSGPRVILPSLMRTKRPPWWRHSPLAVPIAACVVFAVLIAGVLGVRKVVILLRGARSESRGPEAVPGSKRSELDVVAEELKKRGLLESSDPGMDVLPPPAAKQPGRKLPKMLLVGRHPEMFPSLEAAVSVAIPGDIIEIRANVPLLVRPSALKVESKPKEAPLTIRAGKSFQPVLRGAGSAMVSLTNVDVKIVGLHFTSTGGGLVVGAENSDVVFQFCSSTNVGLLGLQNSQGRAKGVQVRVAQCFVRGAGVAQIVGPSVAVTLEECGLVSGGVACVFSCDEEQSLTIRRSTFVTYDAVHLNFVKPWPVLRFSFQMERSVFGQLACCPCIAHVHLREVDAPAPLQDPVGALRQAFGEFHARDNVAQTWEGWAWIKVDSHGSYTKEAVNAELPQWWDDSLRFGKQLELVRSLIHEKGTKPDEVAAGYRKVLPEDLIAASSVLAERLKAGQRYGCDVTQLPIPPAVTLEPYDMPAEPAAK